MIVTRKVGLAGVVWTLFSLQICLNAGSSSDSGPQHVDVKRNPRVGGSASVDYSNGFPSGFTQGLPTFDFSGPITSASESEQSAADTENVGFVHGPPDGFPSLSQLGGDFPSYDRDDERPTSHRRYRPEGSHKVNSQRDPFPTGAEHSLTHDGPVPAQSQPELQRRPNNQRRPLQKPIRVTKQKLRHPGPSGQSHQQHQHHQQLQQHQQQRPEPGVSSSGGHNQYVAPSVHEQHYTNPSHPIQQPEHRGNAPVVLKVSSIKTRPTKLPPLPPPFYAPSPDFQATKLKNNEASQYQRQPGFHQRNKREIQTFEQKTALKKQPTSSAPPKTQPSDSAKLKPQTKNSAQSKTQLAASAQPKSPPEASAPLKEVDSADQMQDGSDDTFWETPSPYISFDNYEDEKTGNTGIQSIHRNGSSRDHDAGEQRFFPSFPPTNPYLSAIHPFITAPARPPLFPGPTANRAPSRSQFGQKYAHTQRGPSGVYSAESHDHGDRYVDSNLLGSGNFEVVRGGTFYEDDENYHPGFVGSQHQHSNGGDDGGDYYHHNGHSSPTGFGHQPGSDFFANFRDFADINPHSRAFSHNFETAVNLESAASERKPQNILDKLESRSDDTERLGSTKSIDNDPMMATY